MFDTKLSATGSLSPVRHTTPRSRVMLALVCAVSVGVCVTLGGCASTTDANTGAGLSPTFGQSVAHNMRAQFVPPTPEQKADTYIPPNAARQALALETYEAGDVELQPVTSD